MERGKSLFIFKVKGQISRSLALYKELWHLDPCLQIIFPIVQDRDKFSNRKQSETNQNDENAKCDCLSKQVQMCFRLYEDSP